MSLSNFFELLQVPQQFEMNQEVLEQHYRLLQQKAHPDNYRQADSITRAHAQQIAGQINEAYQVLKTPLLRAKYLLLLQGVHFDTLKNQVSSEFLMQQLQWQEALEDAISPVEKERVISEIQEAKKQYEAHLQQLFSESAAADRLIETLQTLKYIERLLY